LAIAVIQKVTPIEKFVIQAVRDMREKSGMTQADLAEVLNVSPGFIGKIESPKHTAKYNLSHINKLSRFFDCSPKDFLPSRPLKDGK